MPLRHMFIDMNSFFASCEQQERPELRGRPVIVVPTDAETTACIAASYEAKRFGIKTGTPVWEARRLCRGVISVVANHKRYVVMHNRIVAAVRRVVAVETVMSIDEMSCRLMADERKPDVATGMAGTIKREIYALAGDQMHCSIGIGPNTMLAKVASDMQKPNGLTVLPDAEMPAALYRLQLTDFPGVGPRMERRLKLHGIFTVEQLCKAPAKALSEVWGSKVHGERWFRLLRGEDVADTPTRRQTVSHSHVLPPSLRTDDGAYGVIMRLVHKAAARLRKIGYWCGAISLGVSFYGDERGESHWWEEGTRVPRCHDTPALVSAAQKLWALRPRGRTPFKVGTVLSDLVPARSATPSLFDEDRQGEDISAAMDDVNAEFGASVVYLGAMFGMRDAAPTRIAFTQIPDFDKRVN
ncbi:MAG: DNA polymerase [Planctomycetes bacterium]|nr:DNA polymerase [Planctomycetota bacterium]